MEIYIAPKDEVLIGGLIFLKDWIIRAEKSNALSKLFVKNTQSGIEEELNFQMKKLLFQVFLLFKKIKIQI